MSDSPGLRNWLKLISLGIIWGASFMSVTIALRDFGPLTVVASRVVLGAAALYLVVRALGIGLPDWRTPDGKRIWGFALLMGIFSNALPFTLLSWGQKYVASGFAGVCMAVVPLFVLPLAHVLVPGERMSLRKVVSFTIGFVGVLILIGLDAFQSLGSDFEAWARMACLGAALCYAIGSICTRLCPPTNMLSLSAAALICGAALILPIALWQEGVPQAASTTSLVALIYLAILPTAFAQVMIVQVVRDAGPSFMSLVNYQVPIWSVLFGAVLLREDLPPQLLISLVLILGGLLLGRKRRRTPYGA
ncbi:DMT family transporter [Shimia sediminis]|uniref:DMT family transporter n=1 Tax=Shimia sediminis TaxID=2497945 RepID=UPI000F8F2FD2|nr:DMT family transporter [Shimia sediminis]